MKYLNKVESAASKLDVGRSTIYELMAIGELRSVKIGRSRRTWKPATTRDDTRAAVVPNVHNHLHQALGPPPQPSTTAT